MWGPLTLHHPLLSVPEDLQGTQTEGQFDQDDPQGITEQIQKSQGRRPSKLWAFWAGARLDSEQKLSDGGPDQERQRFYGF